MRTVPYHKAKGEFQYKGRWVFHRRSGKLLGRFEKSQTGGFTAYPCGKAPTTFLKRQQAFEYLREQAGLPSGAPEDFKYSLILKNSGDMKIKVIKLIREIAGLSLKEAKAIADGCGLVCDGLDYERGLQAIKGFESAGARATLEKM